ncbi:MAG: LpxI family protein [Kiritimatiellia bacterium]|jgi:DUF1009 family protein
MTASASTSSGSILIIAGTGVYPMLTAQGARAAGVKRIVVLALRGQSRRSIARHADVVRWFGVGEVRRALEWGESTGIRDVILAGQVTPTALFCTRFDDLGRSILDSLRTKNAHSIFGALASLIAERGMRVIPASCYLDCCLSEPGVLTTRAPDAREQADIDRAHAVALSIGEHDIGQTLVIKDGMILAVEAFEGTDAAIRRARKIGGRGAVVVKVARIGHDMRFDIPVIGAKTLAVIRKAGVTALAFQARRTIFLDREKVIAGANRSGIALVALDDSQFPPAPLRPEPEPTPNPETMP